MVVKMARVMVVVMLLLLLTLRSVGGGIVRLFAGNRNVGEERDGGGGVSRLEYGWLLGRVGCCWCW